MCQSWYDFCMPLQFIDSDWFVNNIPSWTEQLSKFAHQPDVQALEVGSFEGRSAVWMLQNILTHPQSHLTCIDLFVFDEESRATTKKLQIPIPTDLDIEGHFDNNIRVIGAEERVTKLKGTSTKLLRTLPFDTYNIIYIDGSHSARNVLSDAILCWELLKVDGILIFDDYRWQVFADQPHLCPKMAIDAFMDCFKGEFHIVWNEYQLMLRKCVPQNPYL